MKKNSTLLTTPILFSMLALFGILILISCTGTAPTTEIIDTLTQTSPPNVIEDVPTEIVSMEAIEDAPTVTASMNAIEDTPTETVPGETSEDESNETTAVSAIEDALTFIATAQQADGGIDSFGLGASDESGTARAVLALAATGKSIDSLKTDDGITMMDYLAVQAVTYTHDLSGTTSAHLLPASAGLLLAAVSGANEEPSAFGNMDILSELEETYHPDTGAYSTTAQLPWSSGAASELNQAWAIFGLSTVGSEIPLAAVDYLVNLQSPDGSWVLGDPDTTALAITALIASGKVQPTDDVIQKAMDFFATTQLDNGGWRPSWDTDPLNADSTGWIIQTLMACDIDPDSEDWATADGSPRAALLSLQQADGSIGGTYVNAYSTIEALFGLAEQPLFSLKNKE